MQVVTATAELALAIIHHADTPPQRPVGRKPASLRGWGAGVGSLCGGYPCRSPHRTRC